MTDLAQKTQALHAKILAKNAAQALKLPHWPDSKRGTPNAYLCSGLFSAIQGKDRVFMDGVVVASQGNVAIKFTGEQLNQDDLSIWQTLVHLSREHSIGDPCQFSAYEILKKLELGDGGLERERLHKSIIRLAAGVVEISVNGDKTYFGSLINEGYRDELTGRYSIRLNKALVRLYQQNTWIDWEQKAKLKRKPLAQALHGYLSSHQNPFPVKIETIYNLSGSKNKRMTDFKQKVIAALDELVRIEFLIDYTIIDNKIHVTKK